MKILLGDTENFVNQIRKKESWKRILAPKRGAEWTLEKVDDDLFWILNDSIKSLKDQFMIFKNGEFLLFFNYRGNQPPQEFLDHYICHGSIQNILLRLSTSFLNSNQSAISLLQLSAPW